MTITYATSLSDRQGFNRRWFAPSGELAVYRPQTQQDVLDAVTHAYNLGRDPASVQAIDAEYDSDGRLRAAHMGDLWSVTAAFDPTTGLGMARVGAAELRLHEPTPGLRRITITSP